MQNKRAITGNLILKGLLYLSIAGVFFALSICAVSWLSGGVAVQEPLQKEVILGGTNVAVSIVDTPEGRDQGLSGRKNLGSNEGMFFVFQKAESYGFWMKDMLFPIDMIWLDAQYHIIFVKENAQPSSYPEIFAPGTPAQYVLEVPAGFFASHNLKIGDVLEMKR